MSRYTVSWLWDAEHQLADAWLSALDRAAVTRAQAEIDRRLANDPYAAGFELSEGLWKCIVPPLTVFYEIDETTRQVEVNWVVGSE